MSSGDLGGLVLKANIFERTIHCSPFDRLTIRVVFAGILTPSKTVSFLVQRGTVGTGEYKRKASLRTWDNNNSLSHNSTMLVKGLLYLTATVI